MPNPSNHRITKLEKRVQRIETELAITESEDHDHIQETVEQKTKTSEELSQLTRRMRVVAWWKRTRRLWWRLLNTVGVLAGILYAGVTYVQWRDLRHSFQVEQRSWLKATQSFTRDVPSANMLPVQVHIKNVGRSAAIKTVVESVFQIVKAHDAPYLSFRTSKLIDIGARETSPILFPDDDSDFSVPFTHTPKDTDLDDLKSGRSYVAVYGVILYKDQFGDHWTRFCAWKSYLTGSYTSKPCVEYNSVGDGKTSDYEPERSFPLSHFNDR